MLPGQIFSYEAASHHSRPFRPAVHRIAERLRASPISRIAEDHEQLSKRLPEQAITQRQ